MRRLNLGLLAAMAALALPAAAIGQALDVSGLREVDDDRTDLTCQGLTVRQIEDHKKRRRPQGAARLGRLSRGSKLLEEQEALRLPTGQGGRGLT